MKGGHAHMIPNVRLKLPVRIDTVVVGSSRGLAERHGVSGQCSWVQEIWTPADLVTVGTSMHRNRSLYVQTGTDMNIKVIGLQ
jgi:hypothetical protein